jgi:two-component sensor histidine kinase
MRAQKRVIKPLEHPEDSHILTQAIIDTIHEPLIVLDRDLRIIVASNSFYRKFNIVPGNTHETLFYDLGNGQWNIPALRKLLEDVIPKHTVVEGYEIEHTFPFLGKRFMQINAREILSDSKRKKMLLSIFDVTEQRTLETERETLLLQKDLLLKEMQHRVANSLQLIASILLLKAEMTTSKESRENLEDAHERIMTIATIQQQLDPVAHGEKTAVRQYLTLLCKNLSRTVLGERSPITIIVKAGEDQVSSDVAVSLGLLTTELVINGLKHAFPKGLTGSVTVTYTSDDADWTLSVVDNGVGMGKEKSVGRIGLGTSIIGALAIQLHAVIRKSSSSKGTTVSIVHAKIPLAAS